MAGEVKAEVEDLKTASSTLGGTAEKVSALDPGTDLNDAAESIPGADSVAALNEVAAQWEGKLNTWHTTMERFSQRLQTAASNYVSSDSANAELFKGINPNDLEKLDLAGRPPGAISEALKPSADASDLDYSVLDGRG